MIGRLVSFWDDLFIDGSLIRMEKIQAHFQVDPVPEAYKQAILELAGKWMKMVELKNRSLEVQPWSKKLRLQLGFNVQKCRSQQHLAKRSGEISLAGRWETITKLDRAGFGAVNLSTQNWGDILGSWGPVKHRAAFTGRYHGSRKIHMKKKQLVALLILKHQGMWKANWTWKLAAKTCASSSPLAQAHALLKGIGRKWSPRSQLVIFFLSLLGFVFPCFVLGLGFRGLEIFGRPFFRSILVLNKKKPDVFSRLAFFIPRDVNHSNQHRKSCGICFLAWNFDNPNVL